MAPLPKAIVTLLTASSYLPGALVLLHSLQELHPAPRDFQIVCLVTPETVDAKTIGALRAAGYDLVIGVEPIASGDNGQAGLNLMGRPDLNLALTKLHLFRLGSAFSTVIYLDADTLPLRPLDHLFDLSQGHAFSACPDIGWPDCFNSGVMVVHPQDSDFDNLRTLMTASADNNGSFDGADQGLLNKYFSDEGAGGQWNRLPFTYNVTPSAAYQYAPAYKHYAHKINLIHFIGSNKPWNNLQYRAASSNQPDKAAFDYNSLVDRWYDVYDRHVRPTAAHEPNLAKQFTVPEHIAVWNAPGHGRAASGDRLDLGALKAAVERGVASFQPGQYTSLPLEGRVDLIAPRPPPKKVEPPAPYDQPAGVRFVEPSGSSGSDQHHHGQHHHHHHGQHHHDHHDHHEHHERHEEHHHQDHHHQDHYQHDHHHHQDTHHHHQDNQDNQESQQQQQHHHHHHHHRGQHHHHDQHEHQHQQHHNEQRKDTPSPPAPPQAAWDASRHAPPKKSRPEMAIPMKTVYTPAWDEPLQEQRSYYHHQPKTPEEFPTLPKNVARSDWYSQFTASKPDLHAVQAVFPWEEKKERAAVTRSFPRDERALPIPPPPPPPPKTGLGAPLKSALKVRAKAAPLAPLKLANSPSSSSAAAASAPPPRVLTMDEAMASYTNAWDDVASIGRYANHLTELGIGVSPRRREASGLPSPHHSHHGHHRGHSRSHSRGTSQSGRTDSPGGDADDEETDEGAHYTHNSLYHDKHSQTPHPRLSDEGVQASPELSPPQSPQDKQLKVTLRRSTGVGAGVGAGPQTHTSIHVHAKKELTVEKPVPKLKDVPREVAQHAPHHHQQPAQLQPQRKEHKFSFPTYSFSTASTTPRKAGGRVWDPRTDIEVRRQAHAQHVLSRVNVEEAK